MMPWLEAVGGLCITLAALGYLTDSLLAWRLA